jgi:SseB protein N-terminal domain
LAPSAQATRAAPGPGAVYSVAVLLSTGDQSLFRADDGSAEPGVAAALAAFGSGHGSEHAALTALAASRLLVPIVSTAGSGGEKESEISLPTLVGRDGRRAIPAFTCTGALAGWREQARPVPALAAQVWRAAVDEGCAVVVDIAGPVAMAVDGARLAALASGLEVPLPHEDPDVLAAARAAAAGKQEITGLWLAPGRDGPEGPDLEIQVAVRPGCPQPAASEAIRLLGSEVLAALGGRLRRGIAIAVTATAGQRKA